MVHFNSVIIKTFPSNRVRMIIKVIFSHRESYWIPFDLLLGVLLLLQLEDVLGKVVLEVLVGVVDAKLLKAVLLEVLKAEDVEDRDGRALAALEDDLVDALDEPAEEGVVEGLGKGVPRVQGLLNVQWRVEAFSSRFL
jgi:hypothetical protein